MNSAKDRYSYYLPVEVAAAVKEIAASRRVPASEVAAEFLEGGVRQHADLAGLSILLPEVERTIKTELSKAVERIVRLQVRNTLEAMATRRILLNFMDKSNIDRKVVSGINEAGWQSAVRGIREPLADLQEIINAADAATRFQDTQP